MECAGSLRALLERSIDYAGLFPPAKLPLDEALANFASYVRSADAWMLNAFVLPVADFGAANPSRISALGPKTENALAFRDALRDVAKRIENNASVQQIEMVLPDDFDAKLLENARDQLAHSPAAQVFWETPAAEAPRAIERIAAHNKQQSRRFGFKLRTGGVTADAFPGIGDVAAALVAAAKHRVPVKFTAGLHHPLRQHRDEVNTKMHGFLNVLGAGVLALEHGWGERETAAMLEDEDAGAFRFEDQTFSWREWKIDSLQIAEHRKLITSFGSCSFDEPREDLATLGLL